MTSSDRAVAVLVVEDDPLLRWEVMDLAEEAGLTAFGAADADAAIELLERHPEIAILFTDVDMPGSMDGKRLSWAVRDRWPPVRIIVTSALLDVKESDLPSGSRFFPKPVRPGALIEAFQAAGRSS